MNELTRAVLSSEDDKIVAASYNKLVTRVSDLYMYTTVRVSTLVIFEDRKESTSSIDHCTYSPGLNKSHRANANNENISEGELFTQSPDTPETDNEEHFAEGIVRQVNQGDKTKYVVAWLVEIAP